MRPVPPTSDPCPRGIIRIINIDRAERAGRIIPADDPRAILEPVSELAEDRRLAARLAEAGRRYIAERLDCTVLARQLGTIYEDALACG